MSADIAAEVADVLAEHGEAFTLRRPGASSDTDVSVRGKRYGATSPQPLANNANRTTIRVMIGQAEIAAAAWPGPPRVKDSLIDADSKHWVVEACDTRRNGDVALCHFLTVVGPA